MFTQQSGDFRLHPTTFKRVGDGLLAKYVTYQKEALIMFDIKKSAGTFTSRWM